MSYIDKMERHEFLMKRMADRNGADLMLAEQIGVVSPEKLYTATQACTGCSAVADCETHLETGQSGMPDYCRNRDMIERIAGEMRDLGFGDA